MDGRQSIDEVSGSGRGSGTHKTQGVSSHKKKRSRLMIEGRRGEKTSKT